MELHQPLLDLCVRVHSQHDCPFAVFSLTSPHGIRVLVGANPRRKPSVEGQAPNLGNTLIVLVLVRTSSKRPIKTVGGKFVILLYLIVR